MRKVAGGSDSGARGRPDRSRPGAVSGRRPAEPISAVNPVKVKAEELAKRTGVPLHVAIRVVRGEIDLNEALKQMALQDQVGALVARHGIERALAMQVAMGHADLDLVLRRRRVEAHLKEHQGRDIFSTAIQQRTELIIGVHGRQLLRVLPLSQTEYELKLRDLDAKVEIELHKTRIKFACDAVGWQKARKAMVWDSARKAQTLEPVLKPQARFGCSNRRLGEAWDAKRDVVATCIEGECFAGKISYVARWEFGVATRAGVDVALFRHALDDFKES